MGQWWSTEKDAHEKPAQAPATAKRTRDGAEKLDVDVQCEQEDDDVNVYAMKKLLVEQGVCGAAISNGDEVYEKYGSQVLCYSSKEAAEKGAGHQHAEALGLVLPRADNCASTVSRDVLAAGRVANSCRKQLILAYSSTGENDTVDQLVRLTYAPNL